MICNSEDLYLNSISDY